MLLLHIGSAVRFHHRSKLLVRNSINFGENSFVEVDGEKVKSEEEKKEDDIGAHLQRPKKLAFWLVVRRCIFIHPTKTPTVYFFFRRKVEG